jgi:hypothetical protein
MKETEDKEDINSGEEIKVLKRRQQDSNKGEIQHGEKSRLSVSRLESQLLDVACIFGAEKDFLDTQ